jgi:site-specific DNA recombinase
MTKAVALYARVSSERQVQQATIESQLAALRARAAADGCVVLPDDEYVDNGHSGSTLLRPALERLRDRVAQGAVDTLYVHSPDRLARRHAHQVLLLDEFARYGVHVMMIEGRSGDSAEDQLLVQVQGVIAEYERAKIMERSRRGKLHKARAGSINVLSNAPYGYRYVKKLDGTPAHYQVVVHEAHGKRTSTPRWQASTIGRLLRNPSYAGQAAFGKTERVERPSPLRLVMGRAAVPKKPKSGQRVRPSSEWIRIAVPAIVSADLFAAAQEQLDRNRTFAQRNRTKGRYLLAGLTVCTRCGYGYYGRTNTYGGRSTPKAYYYCAASGRGPKNHALAGPACHNRGVRVEQLETEVWRSVCTLLEDPGRMMQEWSRRSNTHRANSEHDAQRADARKLVHSHERTLQRLLDAYEAGAIDLAELTARSERVRARIAHARDELAALEKVLAERHELQLVVARIEEFAQRLRKGLSSLSWEERRTVVRTVVARIEIADDDVTVVYRVPSAPTPTSTVTPEPGSGTPDLSVVSQASTPPRSEPDGDGVGG